MSYPIPHNAFDDRLAVVGTAGSGKTYLTLGAIEHLLAKKSRIIGVDPLGVMWGLRLCADGKTPSPFQPVIFGGAHGDLPINEHAGALIGQTVATMRESCIIDLSALGTKASERRFMLAFLTALYRETDKEPVHLIIDEADMFAPQKLLDKEGDAAKLLGMMETVVRRGRVKGFIPWLITQRPAVLSKDVLSQADGIVALKLTASQDRKALGAWVESTADQGQWAEIDRNLPTFRRGHGLLWIPERGILREVDFPPKATFDSSRTPKRGEKREARELRPLDLGALKARLATVEIEAKANDPKALKAELAKATTDLAKLRAAPPVATKAPSGGTSQDRAAATKYRKALEIAMKFIVQINTAGFFKDGTISTDKETIEKAILAATERATKIMEERSASRAAEISKLQAQTTALLAKLSAIIDGDITVDVAVTHNEPFTIATASAQTRKLIPRTESIQRNGNGPGEHLPPGERAMLVAAAQFAGVDRDQLSVLTGYKRSSRDAYIQRLREKGYIEISGQTISITETGNAALPSDYEPLPTGRGLQEYWLNRLPTGEKKILQVLIDAYPDAVVRDELDDKTGFARSSRDAYLQRMKAKRLVITEGKSVLASENLFD